VEARLEFYKSNIDRWLPDRNVSILVVAGEKVDREVFESLGFKNVIISTSISQGCGKLTRAVMPRAGTDKPLDGISERDREVARA
jgi:hypothetical protein